LPPRKDVRIATNVFLEGSELFSVFFSTVVQRRSDPFPKSFEVNTAYL
jgi:hypothetical protein